MGSAGSKAVINALGPPEDGFNDKQLDMIFKYFDGDGSGELSKAEANKFFIKIVKYHKNGYTEADMPKWFAALDKDGSGELSRAEMHEHKVKGRKEAKQKAIDDEKRAEEERKQKIIDDQIAEDLRIEQEKEAKAKAEREEAERKAAEEAAKVQAAAAEAERLRQEAAKAEQETKEKAAALAEAEAKAAAEAEAAMAMPPIPDEFALPASEPQNDLRGPFAFFFLTHAAIRTALTQLQVAVESADLKTISLLFPLLNRLVQSHTVQENKKLFPALNTLDGDSNKCIVKSKLLYLRFQDYNARTACTKALAAHTEGPSEVTQSKLLQGLKDWVAFHTDLLEKEEAVTRVAAAEPALAGSELALVQAAVSGENIHTFQVPFTLKLLASDDDVVVYGSAVKSIVTASVWANLVPSDARLAAC